MKIAAVTDDGTTISAHFGRAHFYAVLTVEDGAITAQEMRPKAGHHDFAHEGPEEPGHEHGHGWGHGAQSRHARMFATIADCDVLLARGMGAGAYYGLEQAGIRPLVTTVADIDEAVGTYLEGRLEDHPEKLH
jgi:predicted Fe-Mo cluster-binding NifX family protein